MGAGADVWTGSLRQPTKGGRLPSLKVTIQGHESEVS